MQICVWLINSLWLVNSNGTNRISAWFLGGFSLTRRLTWMVRMTGRTVNVINVILYVIWKPFFFLGRIQSVGGRNVLTLLRRLCPQPASEIDCNLTNFISIWFNVVASSRKDLTCVNGGDLACVLNELVYCDALNVITSWLPATGIKLRGWIVVNGHILLSFIVMDNGWLQLCRHWIIDEIDRLSIIGVPFLFLGGICCESNEQSVTAR